MEKKTEKYEIRTPAGAQAYAIIAPAKSITQGEFLEVMHLACRRPRREEPIISKEKLIDYLGRSNVSAVLLYVDDKLSGGALVGPFDKPNEYYLNDFMRATEARMGQSHVGSHQTAVSRSHFVDGEPWLDGERSVLL